MSNLTVGELTGYVDLNTEGVRRGAVSGEAATDKMAAKVLAALRKIEAEKAVVHLEGEIRGVNTALGEARAKLAEWERLSPTVRLEAYGDQARQEVARLELSLAQLSAKRVKIHIDVDDDGVNRFTAAAAKASNGASTLAGKLEGLRGPAMALSAAGMIPVLLGTAAALSATAGAAGLVPAVAMSAAVGIGALKVATSGFGDALKNVGDPEKFAESLEKLSPAARGAATAVRDMVPAWKEMQQSVQERFFTGLGEKISALGEDYLPMMGRGFGLVADGANQAASGVLLMLNETSRMDDVETIIMSSSEAWRDMLSAIAPITAAMIDVGAVGAPILAQLTAGSRDAALGFQQFIAEARASGQLEGWIRGGVSAVGDLGAIVGNLGGIVKAVFSAANMDGAGLLETVRNLTQGWQTWAESAEGQARMGEVIGALNEILQTTSGVLSTILPLVADLIVWFAQLPAPVQSAIVGFVAWGAMIGLVVGKLAPLINLIGLIGPKLATMGGSVIMAAGKWGLLGTGAKAAAGMAEGGVGQILAAMARGAAGMMVRAVAMAASWLVAMGPIGWIVLAVAAAVAAIIYYWDEIKVALVAVGQWFAELPGVVGAALAWLGSVISTGATAAWSWLTTTLSTAVSSVLAWLAALPGNVMYALGYLAGLVYSGALAAWRWLSETLPIIISQVITWLAGLPGRVSAFLSGLGATISAGARAAWNWLMTTLLTVGSQALAWIAGLPGRVGAFLAALPGIVRNAASSAWQGFLSTTMSLAASAIAFIAGLPGRIRGFFSSAGSWLLNAGAQIVNGLYNGIRNAAQGVLNYIADLGRQIAAGFAAAVGIHSPSKVFAGHGTNLGRGLMVGLKDIGPDVIASAARLGKEMAAATAAASRAPAATAAIPALTDVARAAGAVLARMRSGGQMYEDLSWKGAPALVGQYNDQLLDMAEAKGVRTSDPAAMRKFLESVAGGQGSTDRSITVNVHNPLPETSSDSINRKARTLAALGS